MKRCLLFMFCCFFTVSVFAGAVTRYTSGGSVAATGDDLYTVMRTGTAAATGDVVVLTGDVTRGTAETVYGENTTLRSADGSVYTLSMGSGETGRFFNASGKTLVVSNVTLEGAGTTDSTTALKGGAICGNLKIENGVNTFQNIKTPIATPGNRDGVVDGKITISGGTNLFSSNQAWMGPISCGAVTLSGGTNIFRDNTAVYGGVFYANSTTTGLNISGGTNFFQNNTATSSGGVLEGYPTIKGGTTYFTGNVANGFGGALFCTKGITLSGDDTVGIFKNNFMSGGSARNDIYARNDLGENSVSRITISGGTYFFDGGLLAVALDVSGGDTTLADRSISNGKVGGKVSDYIALSLSGGSLSLQGSATLQANVTQTGGSLNFEATPRAKGFGKLITQSAPTGTMNVGVEGFTTMKDATSYTFVQGVAVNDTAFTFNHALFKVATNGTNTTLSLNTTGTLGDVFGQATFYDLIGLDNVDSRNVSDYNLTVTTDNPESFATWLEESTGLESVAMAGYVTVKLDGLAEILGSDHFVWDFSDYVAGATLTGVNVNQWSVFAPEPSSWILLLLGIGLLRRKRSVSMGTQR